MKTKSLVLIPLLFICLATALQAQQWKKDLADYLTNGKRIEPTIPVNSQGITVKELLDFTQLYVRDSVYDIRIKALQTAHHMTAACKDTLTRQRGVQLLVSSIDDLEVAGQVLSMLTNYQRPDFSDSTRAIISRHIERKSTYLNDLMRIAGYLRLQDLRPVLASYATRGNPSSTRWAALLSLARMGDPQATSEIMSRVERLPVNDDVVYSVFPDLIFTRQSGLVAYMIKVMQRDEKNCFTADAEREVPIPCTYRIAEQLATIIEGFPLAVDEHGDLKTTDYVAAHRSLKEWASVNQHYKILDNSY